MLINVKIQPIPPKQVEKDTSIITSCSPLPRIGFTVTDLAYTSLRIGSPRQKKEKIKTITTRLERAIFRAEI